jgi:hypothetical protein
MGWFSDFVGFESSNQNVTNEKQSTSSGRARGYFQITDGTWKDWAGKAGVDLAKYPTALDAPYHLQLAVAKNIPLKRWDPITLRRMSAKGHRFDVNKTLGENMAANGETGMAGNPGAPLPAAAAVVTGAGQPKLDYASPETPIPGATQPNVGPGSDHTGESLASAFDGAAGGGAPEIGGGGGGGGGGMPDAGFGNLNLSAESAAPRGSEIGGPELSQLAELFQLPMIGQVEKLQPPAKPAGWI